jgi:dipeptidyl-peptidase-4
MNKYNVFWMLFTACFPLTAQEKLSIDDLFSRTNLQPENIRGIQWISGAEQFTMPDRDKGEYLIRYSIKEKRSDTLLKASQLAPSLKKLPGITWLNTAEFYYVHEDALYCWNIQTGSGRIVSAFLKEWEHPDLEKRQFSVAYTRGNNLNVQFKGESLQVTDDQDENIVSGRSVHREEFGISKGTFWSPQGNLLAFYRMDQRMVTDYPLVKLGSFPAGADEIKYPMAGQTSHHVELGVFNPSTRTVVYMQTGAPSDQYLTNIAWTPDEKHILIAQVNRAQNEMKMNLYNAADGRFVRTLFTETDPEWVEPLHPAEFVNGNPDRFVWQSERSGTNQLYLYDLEGRLIKQLSNGDFTVTSYLGASPDGKKFFAEIADQQGLERKLMVTDISAQIKLITREPGFHSVTLCDSKKYFIDQYSSLEIPRRIVLSDINGNNIRQLLDAPDPLKNYDLVKPALIKLTTAGGTVLNGRLFKPGGMMAGKKYPVLVYVYGGPHAQMVSNRWMAGANLWLSWMASRGYVVFTLDNRGSGDRGQAFEQVIHRRLGQVEMEDQLLGINYLKSLDFVDSTRIGVHGWSYGGFMTTGLLSTYPGKFKVGVAGGPVIDWKMYEVMYTERYMDTPLENPQGFEKTSLLNKAAALKDRLMLIHCTADDVVVWQHSQEFVKRCVDAGVLIDYMIYPGHGHNVQGKDRLHLMRTITRYLDEHLR